MPMGVPESSTMAEQPRYRKSRNHNQNHPLPISETDPNAPPIPCIIQSTRSKSNISSILLSTPSPTTTTSDYSATTTVACTPKKKNFTSATFRGMGCTASSQVSVPAVIRTSANWEAKKVKKKMQRSKKNKSPISAFGASIASASASTNNNNNNGSYNIKNNNNPSSSSSSSSTSLSLSSSCVAVPDVWCGPGIGFTTDAASVDCVVSRRPVSGRGKVDGERISHRERPSCSVRRMVTPEDIPLLDPDSMLGMTRSRLDLSGSRHHRHGRHGSPEGLAEIVMLQSSLMMGGRSEGLARFRDWRLDVDNMSYEELLELGDRIGYVSTGLKEDEIARCLRKTELSVMDNLSSLPMDMERKCSICQEEYEADDEMGKLNCGHFYHIQCIKQWLLQKNCCPVCKTSAVSQS